MLDKILTDRKQLRKITTSLEFPGSSVVEQVTVNHLVGSSNLSRGAKLHIIPSTISQQKSCTHNILILKWV